MNVAEVSKLIDTMSLGSPAQSDKGSSSLCQGTDDPAYQLSFDPVGKSPTPHQGGIAGRVRGDTGNSQIPAQSTELIQSAMNESPVSAPRLNMGPDLRFCDWVLTKDNARPGRHRSDPHQTKEQEDPPRTELGPGPNPDQRPPFLFPTVFVSAVLGNARLSPRTDKPQP